MSSPCHWILGGCDNTTPLGRITVHVSVCKAPATPDLAPDTVTASGATTTEIYRETQSLWFLITQWLYMTDQGQQVPPQDWIGYV